MVTVCPGSSVAAPPFHATGVAMGVGFSRAGATTVGTRAVTAEMGAVAIAVGVGRGARGFDRRAGSARMTSRLEIT